MDRGAARPAALTPEVRARLSALPIPRLRESDPPNLERWLETQLQPSGKRLGQMVEAAQRLTHGPQPTAMELVSVKKRTIELMGKLLAVVRDAGAAIPPHQRGALERVKRTWSRAVREASRRAEARARAERPIWEPTL